MLNRLGLPCLFAVVLYSLAAGPSIGETFLIPPPGSDKANNATRNITDVIDTLRRGGMEREADQVQELLRNRQVFYRTSGPNMHDAQFVHALVSDDDDKLYFGVQHVNHVDGKGSVLYTGSEGERRRFLTVLTALHEMVHKDQGAAAVGTSSLRVGDRGYALHEIEAYRVSMKKFADKWVIGELEKYLNARGSLNAEDDYQALQNLRDKLFALRNSVGAPGGNGDKVCRWNAIKSETGKLRDMLDALWLDQGSRRSCQNNLDNADHYKQAAIEIRLKFENLGEAMKSSKSQLDAMSAEFKNGRAEYSDLRSEMENPATGSARRAELATRLGRMNADLDDLRERYNRQVGEYNENVAERKSLRAGYDDAVRKQQSGGSGFDQCRIDYVIEKTKGVNKIAETRLPPDMVKNPDGTIGLSPDGKKRPIDLAAVRDELGKMFDYDTKLLSATEAARADDPRTPCYKPPQTATAPVAKPVKKCSGGGLVAAMNCVTERIEQGQ